MFTRAQFLLVAAVAVICTLVAGPPRPLAAQSFDARFFSRLNVGGGSSGQNQLEVFVIIDPTADFVLGTSTLIFTFNELGLVLPSAPSANEGLVPGQDYLFEGAVSDSTYTNSSVTLFGANNRVSVNIVRGSTGGALVPDVGGSSIVRFFFDVVSDTETSQLAWETPTSPNDSIVKTDDNVTELASGALLDLDVLLDTQLSEQLQTFAGVVTDRRALLEWTMKSADQVEWYEVQHRAHPEEAWTTLAQILSEAADERSSERIYQFSSEELSLGIHYFRVCVVGSVGVILDSEEVELNATLGRAFEIGGPYPNPAESSATLTIAVQERQDVSVGVYDVLGRRIARPHRGRLSANEAHRVVVSTSALPSGLYVVLIRGERFAEKRKLVVAR